MSTTNPFSNFHEKKTVDNYGYNTEGVSKADLGKYAEALEAFTKAIEEDPNNFVAYFNRASVRMKLGDINGARLDFKQCEILDCSDNIYS